MNIIIWVLLKKVIINNNNERNGNNITKGKNEIDEDNLINYEKFNYLDKLEEKEEDKMIELFDELNLKNNIKEKNKSWFKYKWKNKDWFTYSLIKESKKYCMIIIKIF